jgi:hypothetical protein
VTGRDGSYEPIIQGRLLKFPVPVEEVWQEPAAIIQNALGVLGSAPFVTAPEVTLSQAVKKKRIRNRQKEY